MAQTVPAATIAAADQRNLGAHKATHLPGTHPAHTKQLDEFERGIVAELNDGELVAVPWGSLYVYHQVDGRYLHVSQTYTLFEAGGTKAHIGDWTGEARDLIGQNILRAWAPWILNHVAQGKAYDFIVDARQPKRNLGVRAEGLHIKGRIWPWAKIRSIDFKAGMYYVKVSGKLGPLAYNIGSIPNAHVLLAVSRALQEQAR